MRRFHLFFDFNSNFFRDSLKVEFFDISFYPNFWDFKSRISLFSRSYFFFFELSILFCLNPEIFRTFGIVSRISIFSIFVRISRFLRLQFFSKFLILLANFRKSCHFFLIHIHSISFKGFMEHTKRYKTVSRPKLYKISLEASCKVSRSIVKIVSSPIKCSILLFPVQLYLSLASTL